MLRLVAFAFAALLVTIPTSARAQGGPPTQDMMPSAQGSAQDLTDVRIEVLKTALQLSPEQAKYWPAIEEAIRSRADERRERMDNLADRMHKPQPDRNFLKTRTLGAR